MATLRLLKRRFLIPGLLSALALLPVIQPGCSTPKRGPHGESAACMELAKTFAAQEKAFVDRVKAIRAEHLLLRDYDLQMIDAIARRREALQATKLTEMSVTEDVAGCSGEPLEEMRRRAQDEMVNLRAFLNDFNRALRAGPPDVFIDAP